MEQKLSEIKGILFDIDGVLYIGDKAVNGAAETINRLKKAGVPCRFSTNTTTKSSSTLFEKLNRLQLPIEKSEIISAPQVAIRYLRKLNNPKCFFCVNDDLIHDFAEFQTSETNPDYIVIGDINDGWNYDILNKMFRMIISGTEIIAIHKGRFWQEPDGLYLDIGVFIAGLEYASGKTATVIGKPNREFFHLAVEDMGVSPEGVIMVGDDINSDIGGAQNAGLRGILVKTGKYRESLVAESEITPDMIINSVADLPAVIQI
ncbi:MAG: TIGR01458 family HAD-type hydrolase [candidate division Zixibacteria bacterium]|nr:TIGR01458 family HAD-type hydrolase [candidate division Zixibacteria bacterium]